MVLTAARATRCVFWDTAESESRRKSALSSMPTICVTGTVTALSAQRLGEGPLNGQVSMCEVAEARTSPVQFSWVGLRWWRRALRAPSLQGPG